MEKQSFSYEEQVEKREKQIGQLREFASFISPSLNSGLFMYATEAMKSLILINAGSAAALLALIGHLVTSEQKTMANAIAFPLCIFLVSAIMSSAAFGFSYLSQMMVNLAYTYIIVSEDVKKYNSVSAWGRFWQKLAMAATMIAFGICFFGIWEAYKVFTTGI
jgi:hypothetical protein